MRNLTHKPIVEICRNKSPAVSSVTGISQESVMAIILNSSITVDETSGLQNAATSTDIEDINDNDITVAAINGTDDTGDLPFAFESRLFTLLGATPVKNAALSGYTGAAGNSGADLITITGTYADLAFTDAQGKALGDPTNANSGSDWSGLYTLDGTRIFLYTDTTNNIVLGRAGTEGATPAPEDDLADPGGTLIFAAYLEETATGAKVWMVQQEPLLHPDTANPDDVVDMTNHLWVTASQDLAFDFAGLPSGQNGFLMFKAGGSTTGLIVTGMDPDQVPANQADTVNTSQGAGPTTIGTNSQGIKAGEGMIFSFVSNPDARYTVPDLTHGEATNESNILFGGLFAASGATIVIAQATPPKTCAATISAFTTGLEVGSAYYDGLLDGNGHAVNGADNLDYIASITVIGANGVAIAGLTGVTTNTTLGSISVTFNTSNGGLDRTATIVGFEANFSLQYTVDGTHNRVVIENSGTGNSTFDIGGFHLPNVVAVPQEVGSLFNFEDDGPAAAGLPVTALVDEDSLIGGIDGGVGDAGLLVPASASGTVATVFTSGTDAPASYSLSNDTSAVQVVDSAATAVALASKGEAVKYDVIGNTLWGYVGAAAEYVAATDRAVFKLELTNTSDGSYTFTLLDQLDHPDTVGGDNSENELLLQLGSVFKVTDKDGDSVTATAQKLVITVDDDTPIATLNPLTGTVDEDGVLEGAANAGPGDGIAGGTGDVAGEIVLASGNVSTLFASGADEPLSYSLTTNGLSALGLKSAGVTVTYAVAFDAISSTWLLTASAGAGNTVFTFSLHTSTGAYAFTLVDQLDHAAGLNENDLTIALGTAINATDFDGDTVTAAANGLVITVNDDTPVATVNQLTGSVDEDGVVEGTANAGPGDGIAGGTGDVAGEIVLASGNVSTLFQSGADEALSYSLTTNGMVALGLQSGGVAVSYAVAFDAGSNTWQLTASAGAGNTVFTFNLHAATGAYAFTLVDQLDHAAGLNENDLSIALGTAVNATDFDGDSVTAAANGLVITVNDDSPIASINQLTGTVDEDGVVEGTANAGPGDGIAGGSGDVAGEIVLASGNVSTLFQSGADEALSYSLTTTGMAALGLMSGGVAVTYAVAFDPGSNTWLLTASAGAGNTVFTFSLHAATGAYAFTLVDQLDHAAGLNENDLTIALGTTLNATDFDGDSVTAAADGLVITVDDDTPLASINLLTGTVDEDGVLEGAADSGPGDGIPGGTGDVAGEIVLASGNVSALFQSGADEPLSYSLTTNGLSALGLKSGGVTVTYATAYDAGSNTWLLTASAGAGNSVFTFSVQAATGAYAFMLLDQLDHAAGLNENDLNIALGTAINATDYDGDSITAAANGLLITVDDDSPVVTAKSNVVYANASNPTPGGTGVFAYDIGADERLGTVYSSANSDLSVSMGDSTVGTTAISNKVVTWASESDTSAVFNLSFTYVSNNPTLGALTNATGTMTFDKVADTYTLSLTDDIDSFSILKTSAAQGFTGYNIGGTTPINQQPPVSVAKLADDFFVQFSGFAEQGSGTGANNIMAGGNSAFVPGELFSAATSWVSVSGTAAGVAGDTIQQGEVMDLDFFTASPFGDTAAAPTATSKGIYVKFDGIGSEDLVLVLKLIDPDDNSQITRAIIVDSEDIIIKNASTSPNNFHPIANPAAYGITLDQNDGAVIIESNDYNFGSENYLIQGLQVLDSTEGVSGSGYNLNGNVGVSGASTGNTLTFSNESGEGSKSNPVEAGEAGTWDGDVIKITDLGFVTSTTPDAHLAFNVVVTDADADSTAAQTLNVTIEGDKTFTGGVGADTFNFSGLDTDSSLTAATTVISSGFTSGVDTLNFPTAGTGANYMEVAAPAANVAAFITAADTALNGTTNYYFGVVGGDGYLAYDGDGTGITGIIKLVGVTDIAPTDIV